MTRTPLPAVDMTGLRKLILAAIAASGGVACSGNVTGEDGGGGAGTSNPSVTSGPYTPNAVTTGAGGGQLGGGGAGGAPGSWCAAQPDPDGFSELAYACTDRLTEPCPRFTDATVDSAMNQLVNEPGGCGLYVSEVVCGPDPAAELCCYVVRVEQAICEGRPLLSSGAALLAASEPRGDWDIPCDARIDDLSLAERAALARSWTESALAEHASIASFARVALELMALGAPADLVAGAQTAMGDEIVHASLSFGVARALDGAARGPGALPIGTLGLRQGPGEVAVATVIEGCIHETLCALVAQAERDAATEPEIRALLDRIAEDEARHAALAWRTVAWLIEAHGAPVREAARRAFARTPTPELSTAALAGVAPEVARRFGRLGQLEMRAIVARGLDGVVRPAAAELLSVRSARPILATSTRC